MSKAKEFYKEWKVIKLTFRSPVLDKPKLSGDKLFEFAESYHQSESDNEFKSRVNAIRCEWIYDDPYEKYDTKCGESFCFINDGVEENGYKHCPNCGNKIKLLKK